MILLLLLLGCTPCSKALSGDKCDTMAVCAGKDQEIFHHIQRVRDGFFFLLSFRISSASLLLCGWLALGSFIMQCLGVASEGNLSAGTKSKVRSMQCYYTILKWKREEKLAQGRDCVSLRWIRLHLMKLMGGGTLQISQQNSVKPIMFSDVY